MDESLICECGNENFWFFWSYARCTKCFNEYKETPYNSFGKPPQGGFGGIEHYDGPEYWVRRFDITKNQYRDNWEHTSRFNKK